MQTFPKSIVCRAIGSAAFHLMSCGLLVIVPAIVVPNELLACSSDLECREPRICENHECVEPNSNNEHVGGRYCNACTVFCESAVQFGCGGAATRICQLATSGGRTVDQICVWAFDFVCGAAAHVVGTCEAICSGPCVAR